MSNSDHLKSAAESTEEREERIKRRRDEAITRVSMSKGQAATLLEVATRPSRWFGFGSSRRPSRPAAPGY
jgi:hypothetical protein